MLLDHVVVEEVVTGVYRDAFCTVRAAPTREIPAWKIEPVGKYRQTVRALSTVRVGQTPTCVTSPSREDTLYVMQGLATIIPSVSCTVL